MTLLVRFFPVRSREGVDAFTREMQERAAAARKFYTTLGVHRESWFFQDTPHGSIVIGVTEVDELEAAAEQYAESEDGFSLWFKQRVYDLSGIDPNEAPKGPPSETVFDSSGHDAWPSERLVVRAYPVRSRDAVLEFANELQHQRTSEMRRFYDGYQVARETWHLQDMPGGPLLIGVTALKNPELNAQAYGEAQDAFAVWFKKKVEEVSGVDPNVTPLGPPSEQIFEFVA